MHQKTNITHVVHLGAEELYIKPHHDRAIGSLFRYMTVKAFHTFRMTNSFLNI